MDPFRIAVAGWGLFIQIRTPLTNNDRHAFIELLKSSLERVQGMEHRALLLDLREIDVASDPEERINAYTGMARLLGAQRFAVVVSSRASAARLDAVLDSAGMRDSGRVLIAGVGDRHALLPALEWVDPPVTPG
ncbi:hypothetical protein [Azospirillum sp.]|uniref:hypothetical protein n=1 Tax=Azospirillum sp. TaxID=34012 RepID=UPI003D7220B2